MASKGRDTEKRVAALNRRARFDYLLGQVFEAGIMLTGTEVKSLRGGKSTIGDSYATVKDGEAWLINSYIPEYLEANRFNHETKRPRKLLLHKREIARLATAVSREGMTIVPLKIFFNDQGRAKVEVALAKGKTAPDKRDAEKKRDWGREKARIMKTGGA